LTRRVANGVALVSRNNSSRFSGRGGKSERGDAREHGVEVLARLRVRGEVAEDDLEQVILRGAAAVARSGRGQHATNAGGANADVVVKRMRKKERSSVRVRRQDARRGGAPAGHPRWFPRWHPRAGGCSCGAGPLPRERAPRVSRTPPRPRRERASRSSPRPLSRFPPSLFPIPRPTRAPPRRAPRRRARPRARPRGAPFPPFP